MINRTQILLITLITIFFTFSCSNMNEETLQEEVLDMSKVEMTTDGMQKVIDYFNKNSEYQFNGKLLSAGFTSIDEKKFDLKNSINAENLILFEILSKDGKFIKVYSSPSLEVENEVIVFTEYNGVITNEVKYNFKDNSDGTMNFKVTLVNNKLTKSWGDCMQGFFSDSFVGTATAVLGVASGVGCVPCGGAAAFFTGVAAIGCLG